MLKIATRKQPTTTFNEDQQSKRRDSNVLKKIFEVLFKNNVPVQTRLKLSILFSGKYGREFDSD